MLAPEVGQEGEDYHDFFITRIDIPMHLKTSSSLFAINLNNVLSLPEELNDNDKLMIIGFPGETRDVDFDALKIKYKCSTMSAKFKGRSISEHCYTIEFTDTKGHDDLNGVSGAPVFLIKNITKPRFAGMMLRASGKSEIGHFVSFLVLKNALSKISK